MKKGFWTEFKEFISKGNVMDMAIGIIIGSGFTAIVNSLVGDIITPLLSILTGGYDFEKLNVVLGEGENAATLNYGMFISAVLDFLVIALVIFILIRVLNNIKDKFSKEAPAEEVTTKVCPFCKSEIPVDATRCPHCTSELNK